MSKAVYDDLEQADGNDLIDERNRLLALIAPQLNETTLIDDFETIVAELTKRENA